MRNDCLMDTGFLGVDEYVLELDSGDGYTILGMYSMPLNCTP